MERVCEVPSFLLFANVLEFDEVRSAERRSLKQVTTHLLNFVVLPDQIMELPASALFTEGVNAPSSRSNRVAHPRKDVLSVSVQLSDCSAWLAQYTI